MFQDGTDRFLLLSLTFQLSSRVTKARNPSHITLAPEQSSKQQAAGGDTEPQREDCPSPKLWGWSLEDPFQCRGSSFD